MSPVFVLSPLVLLLAIGGFIAFIILLIKLLKNNSILAAILVIVPIVLIALFVLWHIGVPVKTHTTNNMVSTTDNPYPNSSSSNYSPIWSEGIENEFEADVYPSKIAAMRSIALKIEKEFRHITVTNSSEMPDSIVIIMGTSWLELAEELRDAIIDRFPEIKCRITASSSGYTVNEAYLRFTSIINNPGSRKVLPNGSFQATLTNQHKSTIIKVNYVEQPWIEDFASFVNSQPHKHYIVAKSNETCLSHGEASSQAIQDAISQIRPLINDASYSANLNYDFLQRSGIVVDKFVQSFKGSTGKIWRQAILLDASPEKLNLLAEIISGANRTRSMGLIRTILSVLGLFVLITIVYAFLNAATRGYYSLTLKIVGVILTAIFLFFILKIRF